MIAPFGWPVAQILWLSDYRAGVTAFAITLLSLKGSGFGIPGGIDMATIFSSAVSHRSAA